MNELINIINNDGVLTTGSREVAGNFDKRHSDVIEKISKLLDDIQPTENSVRYFIPTEYSDAQGKPRKEYLLTRDGFVLTVMGFAGAKALQWKLKYIEAFNKMEEALKSNKYTVEPTQLQCIKETNKTLKFIQDARIRDSIAREALSKLYDIEVPAIDSNAQVVEVDSTVTNFVNSQCQLISNAYSKVSTFYNCYVAFCELSKVKPLTKTFFGRHLRLLGIEQEHRHDGRLWTGIKLKS